MNRPAPLPPVGALLPHAAGGPASGVSATPDAGPGRLRHPKDLNDAMSCRPPVLRRRPPSWLVPLLWTVALGLWGLSRQHSVWRDEAATWQVARRSVADIWRMLARSMPCTVCTTC